ncbi:hypothetical protein [Desulfobulbus oralis]|uniref:hypothetical protein n=1 Tax=Desulfobulbus oralis TaxID=1986146 RepID=UPI0011B0DA22|nr:hypothetical protein [Desulfobulbus oralis]
MNKGVGILKKTLILSRKFILLVLCSLAIFFCFGLYTEYAERSAAGKAKRFCASLSPGDPTSGLKERAIAEGADIARWSNDKGKDELMVIFFGSPFSKHICHIEAEDNHVISKSLGHLD